MRSASTGWWRHMGRGSTWYLVLGSWSVPSPWSLVRRHAGHASQDRILKRGRRTSDQGPSTKYQVPSRALYRVVNCALDPASGGTVCDVPPRAGVAGRSANGGGV